MEGTVEQEVDVEKLRSLARTRNGEELDGVGELAELVGLGNIGAVYQVARESGELVAAKVMHEHIKENDSLRDRFLREATILDQTDHPSSIEVYGTGETEKGEAYFVMEYLEGRPLRQLAGKIEDFPVGRSLQIAEQALDCLEAYHRAEVLHRDLKPANLFVTREGVVKLLDFGLARFRTEDRDPTQAGTAMGTPAYMAPEQALGHQDEIDERTDVFGMGAVLYKLLSGRTIHDIESVQATLVQAATSRPDPLETHAPDVPAPVTELVDRAVARSREERFQSAADMRDAIREARELIRDGEAESLDAEGSVAELTDEELSDDGVDQPMDDDLRSDDFLPDDSSSSGASIGEAASSSAASAEEPELEPVDGGSPIGREPGETTPDEALAKGMDRETGPTLSEESEPTETGDDTSSAEAPDEDPSIVMEADELEGLLGESGGDVPPDDEPTSEPDPPDLTPELKRMLQAVRSDKADGDFLHAMNDTLDTLEGARGAGVRRVTWQIHPHGLEADGGEYHAFDGDLSDLPQTLQAAGFHRLMVETSVDEDELSMFVQWLGTDTRSALPGEDDLATRFRELQLSSIGAGIYPVFRWDDRGDASFREPAANARLADKATSYLHGTEGSWQGLETLADEAGSAGRSSGPPAPTASISSRLVSHADDFLRTPKGVLSLDVASALDDALGSEQKGGSHQLGALFAEIWNEEPSSLERPTRAVRELFCSYVDRELGRQLVEILGTACRKIDETGDRRDFVAAAIDDVEVERLIEVVDQTIDEEDADRDKLVRLLARIAEEFPASRRAEIIATYEFGDDFTRRILRPYRERFEVAEGGNIETTEAADSTPGSEGDAGADEAVRSGESVDWRRAFSGEIYRLFRVAVFEETDARAREKFTGEFLNRVDKLFQLAPDRLSILFTEHRILVNGLPLEGSASSYKALRSVADFLDRFDCNHLSFEQGVDEADIDALLELLHRMSEETSELEAPFEPGSRVRLEQTDPAVRYGMVEPLVGEEPIETRMGKYYAACVTTLGQFTRTSPEERTEWLAPLKRMSQTWVRLSGRSRASTLALTGLEETGTNPAAIVLDSTLLSILMARRLTGRTGVLRRITFAALAVDFVGPNRDDRMTRWNSAAQVASAILANARTDDDPLRRAVTAFEIGRRFDNDPSELPYDETTPKVETLLVGIAREYTAMAAGLGADSDATPREIVESSSKSKNLRVERYLLHLLVDTLGLFTRGMPVELSSRWRGVVLSSNDHVTDFHLPRVRLVRNPDGERVSPIEVDLAEELEGGEYGYVLRRLEDIDSQEASNIEDSMTDSMRRS